MKILFVLPVLPYANAPYAGSVCAWHDLKYVAQHHEVHVVAMGKDTEAQFVRELEAIATIEGVFLANTTPFNRARSLLSQLGRGRLPVKNRNYRAWRERVRDLVLSGRFDVIHVDFYPTSSDVPGNHPTPMVISCLDLWLKLELRKSHVPERDLCNPARWPASVQEFHRQEDAELRKYRRVIVYSEFDAKLLACVGDYPTTVVHPVGQVGDLLSIRRNRSERIPRSVSFVGALDRPVNRDAVTFFAQQVMPELRRSVPDATFHVYGANAPRQVRAACDGAISIFHGFVDNIADGFARHDAAVSPLFVGGGLIFKNLQAMAIGTPLVTSSIANEGIGATAGEHVLIADKADEFVAELEKLFRSDLLWQTLAERGRDFVVKNFSWEENARKFESVLVDAGGHRE